MVCNNFHGFCRINSDRTTAILLAILTVFLLTELPQGLIAILNAIYTAEVHRFIYLTLGDVLDLLSLVNSSVNFVLYCFMSSRYRQTFCSLLIPIAGCKRCESMIRDQRSRSILIRCADAAQHRSMPLLPSFASQLDRLGNGDNSNGGGCNSERMGRKNTNNANGGGGGGGRGAEVQERRKTEACRRR